MAPYSLNGIFFLIDFIHFIMLLLEVYLFPVVIMNLIQSLLKRKKAF